MAGYQNNRITVVYVPKEHLKFVTRAFVGMAVTQGIKVYLAGEPAI
jgi:hypothetical protein